MKGEEGANSVNGEKGENGEKSVNGAKGAKRSSIIFSMVLILALVAGGGYGCWLRWWQPSRSTILETATGYDAVSEPTTLKEVLASAHQSLDEIEHKAGDYSAIIVKQERIGKQLIETAMFAKIREKPFSVYLRFIARSINGKDDKSANGREVIYVQGRNDDKLIAHTPGFLDMTWGKINLAPKSVLAMQGERYPITEIGLANLCRQLIQRGESADDPSQVTVKQYPHARINTRACTLLEITYPVQEPKTWGYLARVFMDNELHFPIRVEVHELPLDRSQGPQLVEEYTYLDLKLNNGYSDADFDPKNPQYKFP